jgi:hypothetical protein
MRDEAVMSILRQAVAGSASSWPPPGSPVMEYQEVAAHILQALDHAGFAVIPKAEA